MYSSASYPANMPNGTSQESRSSFPHSHSHPAHQGSTFTVAGMSNPVASPSFRGSTLGGGPLSMSMSGSFGSPLGDGLGQSRSHYQTGYLMSVAQNTSSQGGQRSEEAPMVQTKAKLNHVLAGSSASDFGRDSMFESSKQRQRQPLAEEDAPPLNSVNDIVNEVFTDSARFTPRNPTIDSSPNRTSLFRSSHPTTPKPAAAPSQPAPQPLYLIVFGYPPDKYSVTVEYFRSIGETTEPEQNTEVSNCFRIGYTNPGEAMRAVRKNGEILCGSWMVGVKFADHAQAEMLLGTPIYSQLMQSPELNLPRPEMVPSPSPSSGIGIFPSTSRMSVDEPGSGRSPPAPTTPTPAVGMPIRLAPSAAAFRKQGTGAGAFGGASPQKAQGGQGVFGTLPTGTVAPSPSKGMLEQVSDLIFGW